MHSSPCSQHVTSSRENSPTASGAQQAIAPPYAVAALPKTRMVAQQSHRLLVCHGGKAAGSLAAAGISLPLTPASPRIRPLTANCVRPLSLRRGATNALLEKLRSRVKHRSQRSSPGKPRNFGINECAFRPQTHATATLLITVAHSRASTNRQGQ